MDQIGYVFGRANIDRLDLAGITNQGKLSSCRVEQMRGNVTDSPGSGYCRKVPFLWRERAQQFEEPGIDFAQ